MIPRKALETRWIEIDHLTFISNFSISQVHGFIIYLTFQKIQLDHKGDNFWNIYVNHSSDDSKNSQSILIVDNKIREYCLRDYLLNNFKVIHIIFTYNSHL